MLSSNGSHSRANQMHSWYRGKMETTLKCAVEDIDDFAIWYTPGVAEPCLAIARQPDLVYDYTSKWNTVIIVSDGSRVLGLGDIGPKAGLPVMEGKALLYKYLGGVDAVPIMLDTKDPDEIIETVLRLQPAFGGVNLEDIAMPKCFHILNELRRLAEIPVWHDDQQGTATVILAGLINALKVVGKRIETARIVFVGAGAAGVATARLVFARGADPANCLVVDAGGILGRHRHDIARNAEQMLPQWQLCYQTNPSGLQGGIAAALRGADVVIAASKPGPDTIRPEWIQAMNKDAIVFACANPTPEIWPWAAREAGAAVVATGRSDFPNQVNNSLIFPGLFRGALDVRARTITDEMCFAAADTLAAGVGAALGPEQLLPTMAHWEVFAQIATAVAMTAQKQGIARVNLSCDELSQRALQLIGRSRRLTQMMLEQGFIEQKPE